MKSRLVVAVLGYLGCSSGEDAVDPLKLAVFADVNSDPTITEINLVAEESSTEYLEGKPTKVWAFRDGSRGGSATVPGPLLDVRRGEQVVVHFTNHLPDPTTIHWHGLRVPNSSDGTPATQMLVAPGENYDYRFEAKDSGLFWYHPHVEGDVQVERGLYGAVVVRDDLSLEVAADRVLMLDDVKLEASGLLSEELESLDVMLGRQGNVLLANGKKAATIDSAAGSRERWRLVNTANGRYFNLAIPNHEFLVIGWDGGLLPEPYKASTLLIAPGERYDVLVELTGDEGTEIPVQTIHYDRGHNIPDPGPRTIFTIHLGENREPGPLPTTWGEVIPIDTETITTEKQLVLSEEEGTGDPSFFINNERYPDSTPLIGMENSNEIWAIKNDSEMDHPFHLHGMSFQVLDVDGVPSQYLGWKDTVNVPQKKTLRFVVRYDAPGIWMYHCHILEHAERGMMGELHVSVP